MMLRMMSRERIAWLVALTIIFSAGCVLSAQSPQTVVVKPGQDIQEMVANSPEGTRFRLEPGVYRQQTIYPQDRQEFIGQEGVILSGAMELRSWTKESGLWKHEDLPHPLPSHGECENGWELCRLREDLFIDGRLYERVASLDELGSGQWYFEDRRAYLADDPTGQSVELSVTPLAFGGDAEDVMLQDLIIEKYASDSQHGAIYIDDSRGWRLSNVSARWNHGAGLSFGPETLVQGGSFSHNGQVGILGIGERTRIEGAEIAFNNYAGYDAKWEAGGTKFWRNKGLVVQNSCVHHNNGPGLWSDIDNVDVVFENNKVFMNADDGIKFEISYGAVIRNNVVAYNGTSGFDDWLWGSQILIQNSSNVRVYENVVEVSSEFGNGIGVIHQDRGDGAYGPWNATNNSIQDNTIVHLGDRGESGVVTDTDGEDWFWKDADNIFDGNTYIVADGGGEYWTLKDGSEVWDNLKHLGFEKTGELIVEQRAPMELSCDR
jgi:Right handed beta helix region